MNRRFFLGLLSLLCAAPALSADALKPGWRCLPAETALALRVPDGEAFYSAVQGTVIGRHFFAPERMDELLDVVRKEAGEGWDEFREELEGLGISVEELPSLLRGESGVALLLHSGNDGADPEPFLLFWLTPEADLSERTMKAFLRSAEETEGEDSTTRVDFTLAGRDVVHLVSPQVTHSFGADPSAENGNTHTLLTRVDNRIIGMVTMEASSDGAGAEPAGEDDSPELSKPDPEPSEAMLDLFARYLRAHEDEEDGMFYSGFRATPGLNDALPSGVPGVEFAVNPERLYALLPDDRDGPRAFLEASGLLDLGRTAFRGTLDKNVLRWGGLVSAPSPRRGILATLLEQRELDPRPPAWVPANANSYSQISMDLGQLFSRIREIVVEARGEEMEAAFAKVDMQVQSMTQANLVTVLSSLGDQHTFIMLPKDQTEEPVDGAFAEGVFRDRMALVWAVRDEEVWQRILQTLAMFVPVTNGALQRSEEQGFQGWRMENESFEAGLFLGRGFLVLGLGNGTVEEVLSSLRNPPERDYSLAGSELYRDAQALLDFRPGLAWEIQNVGPQMAEFAVVLEGMLETASVDSKAMVDFLNGVLDPGVFREAYGVGVSQIHATRDGVVMESAQELTPAPD